MNKTLLFSFSAIAAIAIAATSSHAAILIDFGLGNNTTASPDANSRHWNNITGIPQTIVSLVDTSNSSTGYSLTFAGANGGNNTGTTLATTPAYPLTAANDFLFINAGTTATLTFSNLDVTQKYSFTILASRAVNASDRVGVYTITGNASPVSLNIDAASPGNSNGNTVAQTIADIIPTAGGVITLTYTNAAGSNNAYLNVLEINSFPIPEPSALVAVLGGSLLVGTIRRRR